MRTMIRQGDVLLVPVETPAGRPVRVLDQETKQPLAGLRVAGERTGHAHELPARIYEDDGRRLLFLERPTALTHQEHAHVEVPAGWWEVRTQREFTPQRQTSGRWD